MSVNGVYTTGNRACETIYKTENSSIALPSFSISGISASGIVRSGLKATRSAVNAAFDLNKT